MKLKYRIVQMGNGKYAVEEGEKSRLAHFLIGWERYANRFETIEDAEDFIKSLREVVNNLKVCSIVKEIEDE